MRVSDETFIMAILLFVAIVGYTLALHYHQEPIHVLFMGVAAVAFVCALLLEYDRKRERMEADG